jgi:D-sedoheptulose 7-phosphate isomerase
LRIERLLLESIAVKQRILETDLEVIVRMSEAIAETLQAGGKVLLCGNGGSAADAQHLAAEMLVRMNPRIEREGLPALSLATDMSSITACGNDLAFELYYERLVRALGRPGDVLIGLSTSGNSINIVRALRAARQLRMVTIGLLGNDGGTAAAECEHVLIVSSESTARVQEAHITIGHAVMELVEEMLLAQGYFRSKNGEHEFV